MSNFKTCGMRGVGKKKIPNKIYFVDTSRGILGPYTKMPTLVMKETFVVPPILITYVKDEHGNYIKKI